MSELSEREFVEAAYREYRRLDYEARGKKIRAALAARRTKGEATGYPPVGYRIVRLPDGRKVVKEDPVMSPLVRETFDLYATGNYSLRELLAVMTAKGLRSRTGRRMGVSALWYVLKSEHCSSPRGTEVNARSMILESAN